MQIYGDVGSEIKSIAEGIARRGAICAVLLGVVIGIASLALIEFNAWLTILDIVLGVILAVTGIQQARIKAITLYAYGEMVQRIVSLEEKAQETRKKPVDKKKKEPANRKSPENAQEEAEIPEPKMLAKAPWTCPFCEHKNPAGTGYCEKCGCEYGLEILDS